MNLEKTIKDVANKLGVAKDTLIKLINFESGFNPAAVNKITGASGLIQFMPETARTLGYKNAADLVSKNKTVEKQLKGPVLKYLEKFKPFTTPQSLYMAVFYPAFRFSPPNTSFPGKVQKDNPGIKTVQDYIDKVERRTSKIVYVPKFSPIAFFLPIIAAAAVVTIKEYTKEKRKNEQRQVTS